jgi:hypothetical protein
MQRKLVSLSLSEDGCLCVVGFEDGQVSVMKTDTLTEISKAKSLSATSIAIQALPQK